jgi:hypothetical protein
MRKLWDWFRGTNKVWIEIKKFDQTEIITRRVHVRPFGGLVTSYYNFIGEGEIVLNAHGGTCDRPYIQILRWAAVNHRPLKPALQLALAVGEVDRKWEGDK